MKFRAATESVILIIFLISALVVILGNGTAEDSQDNLSAEEYLQRGNQLYAEGRPKFTEAAVQFWEAIKRNPDMADAHFKLASIYYEYIWNYEMVSELMAVERIGPEYSGLHLLLGKVYLRMGDSADKAFEPLQRAVISQPENSEAHYYLGTVYQQRNMAEEAISEYEKAVKSNSDNEAVLKSHLQLGRIFKIRNDRETAEKEFRAALSIDPASSEVSSELVSLYRSQAEKDEAQGEFMKAAEKYEEILKIKPDDPANVGIYMQLGYIYKSNELYDKAAAMYEAATELDPANFDAYSAIVELNMLRNQNNEPE